jgi:type II secretory pathway pseudopilin PulG
MTFKKLHGYTLVETLIVITLTVIIVSIALYLLEIAAKYQSQQSRMIDNASVYLRLSSVLKHDFYYCENIKNIKEELVLEFKDHSISYRIFPTSVVRVDQLVTDTFKISVINHELGYFNDINFQPKPITSCFLTVKENEQVYYLYSEKIYAVDQLMKLERER